MNPAAEYQQVLASDLENMALQVRSFALHPEQEKL
jgi:hypothetical protein